MLVSKVIFKSMYSSLCLVDEEPEAHLEELICLKLSQ
jgi:hypothetical protein